MKHRGKVYTLFDTIATYVVSCGLIFLLATFIHRCLSYSAYYFVFFLGLVIILCIYFIHEFVTLPIRRKGYRRLAKGMMTIALTFTLGALTQPYIEHTAVKILIVLGALGILAYFVFRK